jgi:hypothetical protein
MAIHYSSGFGKLYKKDTGETILDINYQLVETDQTQYTNKKWWGEFSSKQEIKSVSTYIMEFNDGRRGECIVTINPDISDKRRKGEKLASHYYYRFNGRGKLGRRA